MNTDAKPAATASSVHYHVWFNLKPEVPESEGLTLVGDFFRGLCTAGEASSYDLFTNTADASRSRLPKYHALLRFATNADLRAAIARQQERGIHTGGHGAVIQIVSDFQIEVFERLPPTAPNQE
jgi:hypothetical protein